MEYTNENIPAVFDELYKSNCITLYENHTMIRVVLSLTDSGQFKKIVSRLPIRGHPYLPRYRAFGIVKIKPRKCGWYYTANKARTVKCGLVINR